ncbi:synapsin II [Pelomyxa schiedti]|nr:synapsin II [Pelomyxa schiedti]
MSTSAAKSTATKEEDEDGVLTVLFIASQTSRNWFKLLSGIRLVNRSTGKHFKIMVDQCDWPELDLYAYCDTKLVATLNEQHDPIPGTNQANRRTIRPDLVCVRATVHSICSRDYRNSLYALQFCNVPCVNNFQCLYAELQRPIMYGALLEIRKRLGEKLFPLIQQYYYPTYKTWGITPSYPLVIKVAHPHAGYGKMRVENSQDFMDLGGIVAIRNDYCTAEPLIDGAYDLRIQKIGNCYRAYKRTSVCWKGNQGAAELDQIPMTDRYKLWCDEASKLFGGMDILAVDAIVDKSGKEYILEVNGSEIGLGPEFSEDDEIAIRDVILKKLEEVYGVVSDVVPSVLGSTVTTTTATAPTPAIPADSSAELELIEVRNRNLALQQQVTNLQKTVETLKRQATSHVSRSPTWSTISSVCRCCSMAAVGLFIGIVLILVLNPDIRFH